MNMKQHAQRLQLFLSMQNQDLEPYVVNGRKFDKVYLSDEVKFFIARVDIPKLGITVGDIYGRKSSITPNTNWYYGHISNIEKWDWKGERPVNLTDETVVQVGTYRDFIHWEKKK